MVLELFIMLECIEAFQCKDFGDLSNIAATYIGIVAGFLLGALISWWIYNRQEKTAVKQKEILDHITDLEEKHEVILESIKCFRKSTNF
jgi:uncharacterized membrane-anchored protein YhcB (DUF1043 family)